MVISAISGVGQAVKMEQTQSVKKNDTGVNDEETDKLMEELTNRWS